MADIGVLPTKNSIRITSSNGDHGTLTAATESTAGCMTAEHVKKLEALYRKVELHDGGSIVIETAAAKPVDAVTRGELRAVVSEMQRSISANSMTALPAPDASVVERLIAMEAREMDYERRLQGMAEILDHAMGIVQALQEQQAFIERHAVAAVDVKGAA